MTGWRSQNGYLGKGKCLLISDSQPYRTKGKGCANGGGETPIRGDILRADRSSDLPFIPLLPGSPAHNSPRTDLFLRGSQTESSSDNTSHQPHSELQPFPMGNGTGVEKTNSRMILSCHRMEKAPILNLASQIHVLLLLLFSKTLALLMPCPMHFPLRTRETE